jgi:hypothetical protein
MTRAALDLAQFEGHTPGPWRTRDHMMREDMTGPLSSCGRVVCSHCMKPGEARPVSIQIDAKGWGVAALQSMYPAEEHVQHVANARLIAAAPALLAECLRLRTERAELVAALRGAWKLVHPGDREFAPLSSALLARIGGES